MTESLPALSAVMLNVVNAECQIFINVVISIDMLSVVMLSVVMLIAVASLRVIVRGFVNPTPDGLHPQLKLKCNNLSLMKSYL